MIRVEAKRKNIELSKTTLGKRKISRLNQMNEEMHIEGVLSILDTFVICVYNLRQLNVPIHLSRMMSPISDSDDH